MTIFQKGKVAMTFVFSSNQISGFASSSSSFTLNNPLSFVATRIDEQNNSKFDVLLYGVNNDTEFNPQIILSNSQSADKQSISSINIANGDAWLKTEKNSIPTSKTTQAGTLGSVSTRHFSHIFKPGNFKLKIKQNGESIEQEAINYEANANGLIATFANGVKIQLSSPNTAVQIRRYDLENAWGTDSENGLWAQDLKYSKSNYNQSINTIATADPNSFPIGNNVIISEPIEDSEGRIKVAFQFPYSSATFGINSANPLIEQDKQGNYIVRDKGDYLSKSFFPSFEELQAKGLNTGDYPWYGAYTEDPQSPNTNQSQPFLYLNGALGVNRTDQYDRNLINGTLNNLDPYNRLPDVVGVEGDAFDNFQFVVTMNVPKETVFRPKGGGYDPNNSSYTDFQKTDNTIPGALEGFKLQNDGTYQFKIPDGQTIGFHNPAIGQGLAKTVDPSRSDLTFSEWYQKWWESNTVKRNFPWTGRGYTYDPYYPSNEGWNDNPAIGPGVGELVQSWRPHNANKADWMYEILEVQTIPEALGAASTAMGSDLNLNIKKLGGNKATVYIYEADSITGLLNTAPIADDRTPPADGSYYYPGDKDYIQKAISNAKTTIHFSDLPNRGEEKNYKLLHLSTGKNYGFIIDIDDELFASYGETANQFIALSSFESANQSSVSIGFEDTKLGVGDNDFNDLIFTISNTI